MVLVLKTLFRSLLGALAKAAPLSARFDRIVSVGETMSARIARNGDLLEPGGLRAG